MKLRADPQRFTVEIGLKTVRITVDNGQWVVARIRRGEGLASKWMQKAHKNLGAFVVGDVIHVPPGVRVGEVPWVHECAHVWQWATSFRRSTLRYLVWAVCWFLRYGHEGSPLEKQADRIAQTFPVGDA